MRKKVKDITFYVLSFAIAIFLLVYSFKGIAWKSFIDALLSCKWIYVMLSMILGIVVFWLRGLRWRGYLLPIDPETGKLTCFNAVNIGYLANLALPRFGEVVRCGYIVRHSAYNKDGSRKASFDKVAGTVLGDRMWDIIAMGVVIILAFPLMGERFSAFFSNVSTNTTWLLAFFVAVVVLSVQGIKYLKDKFVWADKVWNLLHGVGDGLKSSVKMDSWWNFIIYTVLIQILYVLTSYTIILAMKDINPEFAGMGLADALFLMVIGSVSTLVPAPGGFGAYHYAIKLGLSSIYGIPPETALIWATLSHESQVLVQILCGGLSFIHETFRKKD